MSIIWEVLTLLIVIASGVWLSIAFLGENQNYDDTKGAFGMTLVAQLMTGYAMIEIFRIYNVMKPNPPTVWWVVGYVALVLSALLQCGGVILSIYAMAALKKGEDEERTQWSGRDGVVVALTAVFMLVPYCGCFVFVECSESIATFVRWVRRRMYATIQP